jgi:hypothetical protein
MSKKVTIPLDEQVLSFVDREAALLQGGRSNRSGFINNVLADEFKRRLEEDLVKAYQRDAAETIRPATPLPQSYLKRVKARDLLATRGDVSRADTARNASARVRAIR